MRIGIDIRSVGKRGTGDEVYTRELIYHLSDLSTEHVVLLFTDDEKVQASSFIQDLPEHMHLVVIPPTHRAIWMFIQLPRYTRAYDLDILHVQYITPLFLPKKTRLITTIHDVSWATVPNHIPRKDRILLNTFIPWSIRQAHRIITVSNHSKQQLETVYPASLGKVHAIYNGGYVSEEMRIPPYTEPPILNQALDRSYILHVSSLQPRKNVPRLIEAYTHMVTKANLKAVDIPLLVLAGGEGTNYDQDIDLKIKESGLSQYIIQTGHVSEAEKYNLYAHARVFTSLSLFEGFGIPFIEAMSFGVPVLGSDHSCLPEIIGTGGETVTLDTISHVAERLYALLFDTQIRNTYAYNGFYRAQQFTWQRMAEQTFQTYISEGENQLF